MSLECKNCGHQFEPFEHFVKLELRFDDSLGKLEYLCENCFFDYALRKLRATPVKNDYRGNIDIDEEQEEIDFLYNVLGIVDTRTPQNDEVRE